MLIRGGFNLQRIYPELGKQLQHINDYGIRVKREQILFSPFQELSSDCLNKTFQLQKVGADYENKNKVTEDTYEN